MERVLGVPSEEKQLERLVVVLDDIILVNYLPNPVESFQNGLVVEREDRLVKLLVAVVPLVGIVAPLCTQLCVPFLAH